MRSERAEPGLDKAADFTQLSDCEAVADVDVRQGVISAGVAIWLEVSLTRMKRNDEESTLRSGRHRALQYCSRCGRRTSESHGCRTYSSCCEYAGGWPSQGRNYDLRMGRRGFEARAGWRYGYRQEGWSIESSRLSCKAAMRPGPSSFMPRTTTSTTLWSERVAKAE